MGIYDRDYIRNAPPAGRRAGGLPNVRGWSVNTWLIAICIAVFVIDQFTPLKLVPLDPQPPELSSVDSERLFIDLERRRPVGNGIVAAPVIDRVTQTVEGQQPYVVMRVLQAYLHFSTSSLIWPHLDFWRLIGFQFLHASLMHLLFNMVGLYFFGSMVERHLGSKRYLAFYLLCGIFGALMYLLLNLGGFVVSQVVGPDVVIPGLLFHDTHTPLVGASAGVFGVLMAGAYLAPDSLVLLFFVLPMRLATLAYALVALALLTVFFGGANAGGEAAHLGGAIAGFYFIRRAHHLHGFFDVLGRVDPTSHHYRHKGGGKARSVGPRRTQPQTEAENREVDRILAKISMRGIHSLTDREKQILQSRSRRD